MTAPQRNFLLRKCTNHDDLIRTNCSGLLIAICGEVEFAITEDKSCSQWSEKDWNLKDPQANQFAIIITKFGQLS